MKKFLLNAFAAALCCMVSAATMLAWKIAKGQKAAETAFALPPGTEALHIGNSHTGYTFVQDPKFRNKVIYTSGAPFQTAAVSLLELDRLGYLDGVKLCTMDCDIATMSFSARYKTLYRHWRETMAYSMENIRLFPMHPATLWIHAATMIGLPTAFGDPYTRGLGQVAKERWDMKTPQVKKRDLNRVFPRGGHGEVVPLHIDSAQKEALLSSVRAVKEVCDRREIVLFLFAGPLAKDHPGRKRPELYRDCSEIVSEIRAMGVAYADFSASCPDSMFMNSDHLHEEGAEKFTEAFFDAMAKLVPRKKQDGKDGEVWRDGNIEFGNAVQSYIGRRMLQENAGAGGGD